MAYFAVTVKCSEQDLHSGVLGGTMHEGMADLVHLMGSLTEPRTGKILIDGLMDDVRPVTPEEEALYDAIEFSLDEYKQECKIDTVSNQLRHANKSSLLMHRWRYPSLSLHGIEGAFHGCGAKTVIPAKVVGKFSIRLVPDQDPKRIEKLVIDHLHRVFKEVSTWLCMFGVVGIARMRLCCCCC
jgi:cytosolic nonspecific dipeptidase